jgi:NAD(P)-dependent dehydrogenase (short-subunit alcohol dehydrogenase family)
MFIAERRPRGKAHEAEGQVASVTGGAHGMGEADAQPFVKQHFDATMILRCKQQREDTKHGPWSEG